VLQYGTEKAAAFAHHEHEVGEEHDGAQKGVVHVGHDCPPSSVRDGGAGIGIEGGGSDGGSLLL